MTASGGAVMYASAESRDGGRTFAPVEGAALLSHAEVLERLGQLIRDYAHVTALYAEGGYIVHAGTRVLAWSPEPQDARGDLGPRRGYPEFACGTCGWEAVLADEAAVNTAHATGRPGCPGSPTLLGAPEPAP